MKKCVFVLTCLSSSLFFSQAHAAVTASFQSQHLIYDTHSEVGVNLSDLDTGVNFVMTVSAVGGNLNSNATGLGVGDSKINTGESISIRFSVDTFIEFLDFGEIGTDLTDGMNVTIGSNPSFDLFTGQPNFAGTPDVWTPAAPFSLSAGDSIVLTTSSVTSIVDVDSLRVTAVPEPSSSILCGFGGLVLLTRRKRAAANRA